MQIVTIRCLRDNFAYLVVEGSNAAVVDPGEAAPVLAELSRRGLQLQQVWATHHHPDHVGGIRTLCQSFTELEVIAHRDDAARISVAAAVSPTVVEDATVFEFASHQVAVLHNPGHTLGAISFHLGAASAEGAAPALFTGDTLFGAGCGRLFEGDAVMMHASLTRLASLPGATRVFFGHEYTRSNLRFAATVLADEPAVAARIAALESQLAGGMDSTPSTMALECATNPFLRCSTPAAIAAARGRGVADASPAAVFAALRTWKDTF